MDSDLYRSLYPRLRKQIDDRIEMATGFLKVDGDRVVDANGEPVLLRGTAVGGWMKYYAPPNDN